MSAVTKADCEAPVAAATPAWTPPTSNVPARWLACAGPDAVPACGGGVHFEPRLAQDSVEETAHIVVIFNYYGNTKIAHSCPSNRQYHRIAQRNAGSTSRLPTVQRG